MKYLIITDIHGSKTNLEKVLSNVEFDKLLLLGDVLPHGPRNDLPVGYAPKEVIALLNPLKDKIICVRGNCDAEVDDMVLEFPILSLACIEHNGKNIYLTHGHKYNSTNPLNTENAIVLYGHTHITKVDYVGTNIYLNIGSITLPKDNKACFAVLENSNITVFDLNNNKILEINF
jgi:putative phosphoesterase